MAATRKALERGKYINCQAEAAWVLGLKLKLKEGTLRSWFAAWKRLQSNSKGEVKSNSGASPAIEPDGVSANSEVAYP